MNGNDVGSIPRGVCPACLKPIHRHKIIIVKQFPCPLCGQMVITSILFRVSRRVTIIGLATVLVLMIALPLVERIILWVALWLIFNFLYVWIASLVRPRLELYRKTEDFQTLDLGY